MASGNSGGCIIIVFHSDLSIGDVGFRCNIECIPCPVVPYIIILGQGGTITTCGGTLLDPGGIEPYGNNLNVTQTICSGTSDCISLTFTSFATEFAFDRLSIYDGTEINTNTQLGTFAGTPSLPVVTSSNQSSGCLTLVFETDETSVEDGFSAIISCSECVPLAPIPTGFCAGYLPFCTDVEGGYVFLAATNVQSEFSQPNGSSNIGCLGSTPNPSWYYMRIAQPGNIQINIVGSNNGGVSGTNDIDYVVWGPFANAEEMCELATDSAWANDFNNIVDCSYSGSAVEQAYIDNSLEGQYYLLLLTNFSNQPTNIYFSSDLSSTGRTDCTFFCEMADFVSTEECDPNTNTYRVNGEIEILNPPLTGSLTVINSSGGFVVMSAPFPASVAFTFDTLSSDGTQNSISAYYSNSESCAGIFAYSAPPTCSNCPVTASIDGVACEGEDIVLTANGQSNTSFLWTGPNGFTSNLQSPALSNISGAAEGVYPVFAMSSSGNCQALASVNLLVNPIPETPVISINNSGDLESNILGASFIWTKDGSVQQGFNGQSIPSQGDGIYTVAALSSSGCFGAASEPFAYTSDGFNLITNAEFNLFPNPAKESVTVYCKPSAGIKTLNFMDISGRLVKTIPMNGNETMQVSLDLQAGVYWVDGGGVLKKMLVIQ